MTLTGQREVEMMRTLIVAYFAIARKRIQDTIPKAVRLSLSLLICRSCISW